MWNWVTSNFKPKADSTLWALKTYAICRQRSSVKVWVVIWFSKRTFAFMKLAFWQIPLCSPVGDNAEWIYREPFAEARWAEAFQGETWSSPVLLPFPLQPAADAWVVFILHFCNHFVSPHLIPVVWIEYQGISRSYLKINHYGATLHTGLEYSVPWWGLLKLCFSLPCPSASFS